MEHMKKIYGFTLIELAFVMVIIGILTAGIFRTLEIQQTKKRAETSDERVANSTSLLAQFASNFDGPDPGGAPDQRLPCPSNPTLTFGQAGFGVEQCPPLTAAAGTVFNGVTVAINPATGNRVFIGALPTATMGAKGDDSWDGYNQKLVYAVSANLTVGGSVAGGNPVGDIIVNVDGGGTKNDAPFTVISTGRNGLTAAGTGPTGDNENLDGDHIFSAFTGHSTAQTAQYFDDEVAYQLGKASDCTPNRLDVQEFSSNGTWTKPPGFLYAEVEIWGAQGGPASCNGSTQANIFTQCRNVDIGGSGGYTRTLMTDDDLNSTEPVVIGAGGRGGCLNGSRLGNSYWLTNCTSNRSGRNATTTSFAGISLTGGQGAQVQIVSGRYAIVRGNNGTGTGSDFFSTSGVYLSANNNSIPTTYQSQNYEAGASDNNYTSWAYWGGKGSDGYALITSYVCQ